MISKSKELEIKVDQTTSLSDMSQDMKADILSIKLVEELEKQLTKCGQFLHIGGTANANETQNLYEVKDIVTATISASNYTIKLKYDWKVDPKIDLESLFKELMK